MMLLGKRQRPPPPPMMMKRTTSITEFTLDLNHSDNPPRSTSTVKAHRRNSAVDTTHDHFLRACHLCTRPLIAGRDIFMYRGDTAFCTLECRQQQMNQDEKCNSMSSNKHTTPIPTTSPNVSETVAAL